MNVYLAIFIFLFIIWPIAILIHVAATREEKVVPRKTTGGSIIKEELYDYANNYGSYGEIEIPENEIEEIKEPIPEEPAICKSPVVDIFEKDYSSDSSGRSEQLCGTCVDFKIEDKIFVCKKCGKKYKSLSAEVLFRVNPTEATDENDKKVEGVA